MRLFRPAARFIPAGLFALLALFFCAISARAGSQPAPKAVLRVNIQTSGEGLPDNQAVTVTVPPNNEEIQIRALPEATERNLIGVKTDVPGYVRFIFDHQGQINLSSATGQNEGRILIVAINGIIIYAPLIDKQISNGELDVPHPLPPDVIKILQDIAAQNVKRKSKT